MAGASRASSRRSTTGSRPRRGPAAAPSTRSSSGRSASPASTPRSPQDNFRRTGTRSSRSPSPRSTRSPTRSSSPRSARRFGGNLRACVSGSAALAPEIGYFFAGAGSTSSRATASPSPAPASFVNPGEAYRTGTVGKPLPGTEVRIADDGEILLRGPGVMQGYHGLPEKTAEVLESRRLVPHRRHRRADDGRLPADHRPQEGPDQDLGRQVHRPGRSRASSRRCARTRQHPGARRRPELLHGARSPSTADASPAGRRDNGLDGQRTPRRWPSDPVIEKSVRDAMAELNAGLKRWQTIKSPHPAARPRRRARRAHAQPEAEAPGRRDQVRRPDPEHVPLELTAGRVSPTTGGFRAREATR